MDYEFVISRHTQTYDNAAGIYSGQRNTALTPLGIEQISQLGKKFRWLSGVCGIISSDLLRAKQLADHIGHRLGIQPIYLPALREVSLGRLEGCTKEEVRRRYPGSCFQTSNPRFDFTSVGGETAVDVITRHLHALRFATKILAEHRGRVQVARLVIVGHGTALRLTFRDYLSLIDRLHEQGDYQVVPWAL